MLKSIISFFIILVFSFSFIEPSNAQTNESQHEGMNHEGMNHEGMNHEGMNHEGMNHEGMNHEGMNHEGMNHEGMNHEGMNHEGMNHEGMNHEGMNHEGMNHEGMNHEGMNHEGMNHDHEEMIKQRQQAQEELASQLSVVEKLGEKIDLNLTFKDELGKTVTLKELGNQKPFLLVPVFYSCPDICHMMLGELGNAIPKIPLTPAKDYNIITFSFDHEEGELAAQRMKKNFIELPSDQFPHLAWRFLTADLETINKITTALGYPFKRLSEHNYVHPAVIMAISPSGTIIRYLYGPQYLPFDLGMSLSEALEGTPVTSIRKFLSYCFNYDPQGRKYVFSTFRVFGFIILFSLLILGLFLYRSSKKPLESFEERLKKKRAGQLQDHNDDKMNNANSEQERKNDEHP